MFKICYYEESDHDFIRWTGNLLRNFLVSGRVKIVRKKDKPDLMLASIWRKHPFPRNLPVALISNENWRVFPPRYALNKYQAVMGIYPPPLKSIAHHAQEKINFIQYPYEAVHFDLSIDHLFALRERYLKIPKTKFCCFVVSNTMGDLSNRRMEVFREINAYKSVDSAGSIFNNVDYRAPRGLAFLDWIAQYKFMICLENSKAPGYVTEKALQASLAGTIPIYDGGGRDVYNSNAYVNASSAEYLQELIRLDSNADEFEQKRHQELYVTRPSLQAFEESFAELLLR